MAAIWGREGEDAGTASDPRRALIGLVLVFMLVLLLEGGWFGHWQDVWIDESTQLSGAMLPPRRMLAWLAGHPEPLLGVPADRMPPLSYALDAICLQLFGTGVFGLRLVHLAIATAGMATLVRALGARYGLRTAVAAALLFALSPKIIEAAVELRAYPIFLAITCLQIVLLLRLVPQRSGGAGGLVAFTLAGIAAVYTHFFGLVSSSALFVALGLATARDRGKLIRTIVAYLVLLAASLGILPFVAGSATLSAGTGDHAATGAADLALFVLRLAISSATMLNPVAAALALGGFAALLLVTIVQVARRLLAEPRAALGDARLLLLLALGAGLAVTVAAGFAASGFNPLKPSYSLWVFPILVTLAGVALAEFSIVRALAAAAFVAGGIWSTSLFLVHARWFVHGPERVIAHAIGPDPSGVVVAYEDGNWAYAYFPLRYRYGGRLAQAVVDAGGRLHRITAGGAIAPAGAAVADLTRARAILAARLTLDSYADLRATNRDRATPRSAPWPAYRADERIVRPGLYAIDLTRFVRKDQP